MPIKIISLFSAALTAIGCSTKVHDSNDKYVAAEDITKIINQNDKNDHFEIIDLRTPKEINDTGIIKGAIINDFHSKNFEIFIGQLDKNKDYIVYCKAGGRSAKAARKMRKLGFNVKDYSEGMDGWLSKKNNTMPARAE